MTQLGQQELIARERHEAVRFTAFGDAKPGGSKKAFAHPQTGRIVVVDDSKNKPWKKAVASEGLRALEGRMLPLFGEGPLGVEFVFYRQRPQSQLRANGAVKDNAPAFPTTRPDVLKLARAVEDALTGIIYRDDSQIVEEYLFKRWGEPRVEVSVWRIR
jgi:Holliday junction resolvase RusA-like endonuclease